MKIKNLFAVAALLMASASAFAQHVISPVTLVDNQGINYNVVEVYKNQNIDANEINTVTVAITNDFAGATLNIPDEVTLTLNAGSKDENATPIEGAFTFRVIGIVEDAFRNNRNITTVNIGKYVARIGANAFNSCTGVTAINFAEGSVLSKLGEYCFGNTPKLTTLNLDNCASLTDITNVLKIGDALDVATPTGTASPFYTSATTAGNNYLTTLKVNKVQTIDTQLSALSALTSVEFTDLTALNADALKGNNALASLSLPAACVTIAAKSLDGTPALTSLTINTNDTKAPAIGDGSNPLQSDNKLTSVTVVGAFKGDIKAKAFGNKVATVVFGDIEEGAKIGAAAFNGGVTSLTVGEFKSTTAANIAAGAIVLKNANATVSFTKFSGAGYTADFITGTAGKVVTLGLGEIAANLTAEIVSAADVTATTGIVNAKLSPDVLGNATSISFGELKSAGEITSATGNAKLISVVFTGAIAKTGAINADAFAKFTKLATVEFLGNIVAGGVATGAFGGASAEAGSGNITATNKIRLTVTYKPTVFTLAFATDAFLNSARTPEQVVLVSNMTFVGNALFTALNDVVKSFAGETREIEMLTVSGQSTWYGKFVADGCNYAIATTNADGKKVVVYEAYLDENADTQIASIVMLPLTRDGNYYIVKEGQAVIVRAWGEGNITAEATIAVDTHNYYNAVDGLGNPIGKNEIQYYEQGTSYNYLDVSVDASVLNDACLAAGYSYMYAVKKLDTNAFQWGKFEATAGLMPKYTLYVYTHFQGENPASGRLNIIWADGEDGEATAIETVKNVAEDGEMFNLSGQKVNANYKGVVIKNGKKVILK